MDGDEGAWVMVWVVGNGVGGARCVMVWVHVGVGGGG
jgi:hypothetical protein